MDSICRIDQRSVCLRLRRVTPRSPPMQPQSSTARRRHTTAGSAAVPFHTAESASGTARNVLWSSPVSRPRAFLRNAAVSAHSRLPMHTAVVASIGTTLPEQPCPAISCAKHAKAAAVTATPAPRKQKRKKLRRETSRLRHNKTASLHIVYARERFMYARCKRLLLVGRSLVHVQL